MVSRTGHTRGLSHRLPNWLLLQVISILPLAAVHTLGNLLTNVSLGAVAVSFTHTIKVQCCAAWAAVS